MIVVIIDFDNYFRDNEINDSQKFELALTEIVEKCETNFQNFNEILIRLYGGWYQGTTLTKKASILQQLLSQISMFPKIQNSNKINGTIEMVSSLFEIPNVQWHYTYKEKDGIGRVRLNHDLVDGFCTQNKEQCPKYILYKFTAKKDKQCHIQNCTNTHKDVFKGIEQKMVDTMIACDVVSAVNNENVNGLFILSDDQDHFPSYAIASEQIKQKGNPYSILLGIKNNNDARKELITILLNPFNNIKIISML
jgi:uncharacterized LabA/DUF88 family protein